MKLIERTSYLNRLKRLRGTPDIKIITGIRRSGKSQLLQDFRRHLRTTEPETNVIFIDFTSLSFESVREYHALNTYVEENIIVGVSNVLMVDEVQMCPGFELAVNSLHSSGKMDIYLTGSNAFLLSADLATLFTGRYIEVHVLPFSFKEFIAYFPELNEIQEALDTYVVMGGMSGSYLYNETSERENYLRSVYETIITRDLSQKYRIGDTPTLMSLGEFAMDNIGNVMSPNSIANSLASNKIPTSHVTVGKYLKYLSDAFVLYKAERYDIHGKKYLESLCKYYLVDTGFRYALLGRRNMDWGHAYENIVFMELTRRQKRVYVGKMYGKEVDFVVMSGSEKEYVQVCDNLDSPQTLQREANPLLSIKDAYPKIIIARTRHHEYDYQGIRILDLAEWLLTS